MLGRPARAVNRTGSKGGQRPEDPPRRLTLQKKTDYYTSAESVGPTHMLCAFCRRGSKLPSCEILGSAENAAIGYGGPVRNKSSLSEMIMAGIFQCAPISTLRRRAGADQKSRVSRLFLVAIWLVAATISSPSLAVTTESPEVRQLIEQGLSFLEQKTDTRLGGRCLIALAFYKNGASLEHPRIVEALKACRTEAASNPASDSVYSNGLAIIFLSELNDPKYHDVIRRFAGAMAQRQKPHGGWGYDMNKTGDTSQTQYAALGNWELMRVGIMPDVARVDACANWLLRTQDPSGAWGYQGIDPRSSELVIQNETSSSMLVAGLGSLMICGNMLGIVNPHQSMEQIEQVNLPAALRRATDPSEKKMRTLVGTSVHPSKVYEAIKRGQTWFDKNFEYGAGSYPCYELYSLERYKSFEEVLTGFAPEEPDWYQKGYEYLKKHQLSEGSWKGRSSKECATAFAVLFLLRSTQKSIKASLGEGTLIGGRGLSADLSRMKMRNGRLVTEQKPTEVDQLLAMLEDSGSESLEALMSDSAALSVGNVGAEEARRLRQIVKSGQPEARLLAVRALGRMRDLDNVPTLLYAMTDPDRRVVLASRDGLRLVSRRFQGFGLQDNFNDTQRYDALDEWKMWYRRVRPNAPPLR